LEYQIYKTSDLKGAPIMASNIVVSGVKIESLKNNKDKLLTIDNSGQIVVSDLTIHDVLTHGQKEIEDKYVFNQEVLFKKNIIVTGETITENKKIINLKNNFIIINSGEEGDGVSTDIAGIKIDRGTEPPYYFIFNEQNKTLQIGLEHKLSDIVTVNNQESGIVCWDSSKKQFITYNNLLDHEPIQQKFDELNKKSENLFKVLSVIDQMNVQNKLMIDDLSPIVQDHSQSLLTISENLNILNTSLEENKVLNDFKSIVENDLKTINDDINDLKTVKNDLNNKLRYHEILEIQNDIKSNTDINFNFNEPLKADKHYLIECIINGNGYATTSKLECVIEDLLGNPLSNKAILIPVTHNQHVSSVNVCKTLISNIDTFTVKIKNATLWKDIYNCSLMVIEI